MRTEAEVRQALKDWIARKNGKIKAEELTGSTPLLEKRIITSLQVMELILYVESLRQKPIDIENLKPGIFSSIDAVYESFFAGMASEGQ